MHPMFNRATAAGECLLLVHNLDTNGRPRVKHLGVMWTAYRLAWTLANGPIPDGLCVCHRCDRPNCIRVEHLFLGTQADNIRDKMKKGRHRGPRGERSAKSKLTDAQVRAIRERYAAGGVSYASLAAEYGMSHDGIRFIVKRLRRQWS